MDFILCFTCFFCTVGGPGCSSQMAVLTENGPCNVNDDGLGTTYNPYSWTNNATGIFLDQPAGVGYSFADADGYVINQAGVARDAYRFLQAYFKANPELQNNPFHIFAESYGGHYAPAIADAIFHGNKNLKPGDIHINLQGVGIGNGLTNPVVQYEKYPEYAYNFTRKVLGAPGIFEFLHF